MFIKKCDSLTSYPNSNYHKGTCETCKTGPVGISHCKTCKTEDWGITLKCHQCEEHFELNEDSQQCVVANCDVLLDVDNSVCMKCEEGYYLHDGKCLDACPLGTYVYNTEKCMENCPNSANNGT